MVDLEMSNRFSLLYLDEENDDLSPPVECVPSMPSIPSTHSAFTKPGSSTSTSAASEKKKQQEFRNFGDLPPKPQKDIFQKRNPFRKTIGSRYAFKDDTTHKPLVSPIQLPYKFIDESVSLESFLDPEEQPMKSANKSNSDCNTIIFSSTIGNRISSNDLTSLPL